MLCYVTAQHIREFWNSYGAPVTGIRLCNKSLMTLTWSKSCTGRNGVNVSSAQDSAVDTLAHICQERRLVLCPLTHTSCCGPDADVGVRA